MGAQDVGRRLLAGLIVLILSAGCAGLTPIPTPVPTATAAATPALTPVPAPTPTPTVSPTATSQTGPMAVARQIHTATLLADGRVLVAGGYDGNDAALASAEAAHLPAGDLTRRRTGPRDSR